jgi:hypothetical protein
MVHTAGGVQGGQIAHAIQLPSGDIVDFIARDTLPGLPYEPPKLELPQGVGFGLTELEQLPGLAELLANAVPYLRPTFWPYILGDAPGATSIEDYLARYQVGGQGDGTEEPLDDYYAQPFEPLCYGRSPLTDGILSLGGPGGFNPACKWP